MLRISSDYKALDRIDLKILDVLQKKGRIKKIDLSEEVGLSPTPCNLRMERLEKLGIIKGYHADIDFVRLANISIFVAELYMDKYVENSTKFETFVASISNVVECIAVLGEIDYVIKVYARSVQEYQETIKEILDADVGIADYRTFTVSKYIKRNSPIEVQNFMESGA